MTTETKWTEEEQDIIDNSYLDEDVFLAGIECGHSFEHIEDSYNGEWQDDEEFAQNLLEDIGDLPSNIPWYIVIDWEATARHIMMDYCEHEGHYFRM